MPISIASTASPKHTVVGGVLEEWEALVQRESAYRLTEVEVEAYRMALSSSPLSVSIGLKGGQYVVIDGACTLAWQREKIVEWCYLIIDSW